MQKLTDLTKEQLIDLIIREREQNTFFEDAARYRYIRWPNALLNCLADGNMPSEEKLDSEVDEAIAEEGFNTHRVTLGGWQPIESAPKDGTFVLINEKYSESPVVAQFESGRWWVRTGYSGYTMVDKESAGYFTHWQPLPTPPAEV